MDDWNTVPFVDITVVSGNEECPSGTELVIWKPWLGTVPYCVCNKERSWMHKRGNCLSDQTSINWSYDVYYCVDMEPLPAVIQGSFYGSRICGTRSGNPFVDAIRVDESGKCPDGTKPCSSNTSL